MLVHIEVKQTCFYIRQRQIYYLKSEGEQDIVNVIHHMHHYEHAKLLLLFK